MILLPLQVAGLQVCFLGRNNVAEDIMVVKMIFFVKL
jgi:hypothetical protein